MRRSLGTVSIDPRPGGVDRPCFGAGGARVRQPRARRGYRAHRMLPDASKLGPLVETFGSSHREGWRSAGWVALCVVAGAAIIGFTRWAQGQPVSPRETPEGRAQAIVIFYALGGVCVFVGVLSAVVRRLRRRVAVDLHEGGIVYRRAGDAPRAFTWEEVESVTSDVRAADVHGVVVRTTHKHTVTPRHGERVVLSEQIADVGRLADAIAQAVADVRLPEARAAIARGGTASFGPVGVAREGVTHKGALHPWVEVTGAEVAAGVFVVRAGRKAVVRVAVSAVPNVGVAWALVSEKATQG